VHDKDIPTFLTRVALYRYVLLCSFGWALSNILSDL